MKAPGIIAKPAHKNCDTAMMADTSSTIPEATIEHQAQSFCIVPNCLYSLAALESALAGIVDIDRFLARIKPRKCFKSAYWGRDLIQALDQAPDMDEVERPHAVQNELLAIDIHQIANRKAEAAASIEKCPAGLEPLNPKEYWLGKNRT